MLHNFIYMKYPELTNPKRQKAVFARNWGEGEWKITVNRCGVFIQSDEKDSGNGNTTL